MNICACQRFAFDFVVNDISRTDLGEIWGRSTGRKIVDSKKRRILLSCEVELLRNEIAIKILEPPQFRNQNRK